MFESEHNELRLKAWEALHAKQVGYIFTLQNFISDHHPGVLQSAEFVRDRGLIIDARDSLRALYTEGFTDDEISELFCDIQTPDCKSKYIEAYYGDREE